MNEASVAVEVIRECLDFLEKEVREEDFNELLFATVRLSIHQIEERLPYTEGTNEHKPKGNRARSSRVLSQQA